MKTNYHTTNKKRRGNWKTYCGAAMGIGLLLSSCSSDKKGSGLSLPDLEYSGEIEPPSESQDAARKVFNKRFADYGDSYYTIRVVCLENTGHLSSKMQQMMKGQEPAAVDHRKLPPHILSMELIQLKGLKTVVSEDNLSEADKLNKVSWRGTYVVKAEVERRRNLDLLTHVRELDAKDDVSEILWTEKPLTLAVSGKSWKQFAREESKKPKKKKEDELGLNFFSMMMGGGNLVEETIKDMSVSKWGEWWEPEGSTYQQCKITIRDDALDMDSSADADQMMGGTYRVSTVNPEAATNFLSMMMTANGEEVVFLLKPNMDELEEAGMLEE